MVSDDRNMEELNREETPNVKPQPVEDVTNSNEELVDVENVDVHERDEDGHDRYDRGDNRRGGGYRGDRARGEMSFEEKMRAFKKQSEERLLHIKRSREAKIGKKKLR